MSTIPQFDPLSSEVVSPFLAGMSEGLNKISTALNLTNAAVADAEMSEVYIGEDDRYRIYQVAAGNRLWLSDPAPVIKKNGSTITAGTAGFTIDYVGGAIIFESASRLTVSDTVTASVTRIASASTEIVDIKANVTALQGIAGNFKGYYATKAALDTAYPTGANGNYAVIGGTVDSIYIWDATTSAWVDIYKTVDLSSYYTKTEANALLAAKEGTITAHGADPADDAYYYGGRKTWIDLGTKVRSAVLTGIDVATSAVISATDTVLGAIGKLQAQITGKPFISAEGDPTTSTVGTVGQRLVNISSGNVFGCTSVVGEVYTWVRQGSTSDLVDSNVTNAKLANMANSTIKGNVSGSAAAPSDLTVAQVRGIITEGTSEVDAIADGDKFVIEDVSATAGVRTKHVLWSAIKTALRSIFMPYDATSTNLLINGGFPVNQHAVSGTVTLAAGAYGHDRWKAGASGCTYTFATSENVTTLTISAGSLIQVVEGLNLKSGTVCLSWIGTAQGKIGAGSYSASGVTGTATGGTNLNIEFNTGTLSKVQLNYGSVSLPYVPRSYADELRLCMRFYQILGSFAPALVAVDELLFRSAVFPVEMRTSPTATINSQPNAGGTDGYLDRYGAGNVSVSGATISVNTKELLAITKAGSFVTTAFYFGSAKLDAEL